MPCVILVLMAVGVFLRGGLWSNFTARTAVMYLHQVI